MSFKDLEDSLKGFQRPLKGRSNAFERLFRVLKGPERPFIDGRLVIPFIPCKPVVIWSGSGIHGFYGSHKIQVMYDLRLERGLGLELELELGYG
jgi:hypothetical protein